jgi:hypothetical protein
VATDERFLCPACGALLKRAPLRSRRGACPKCAHVFEVEAVERGPESLGAEHIYPNSSHSEPKLLDAGATDPAEANQTKRTPQETRRVWFYGGTAAATMAVLCLIGIGLFHSAPPTQIPPTKLTGENPQPTNTIAKQGPPTDRAKPGNLLADQDTISRPPMTGTRRAGQPGTFTRSRPRTELPGHDGGRKLAFLVGVKEYRHSALSNLDFPENDVTELADILKPLGFQVVVLTTTIGRTNSDLNPTVSNIREQLAKLLEKTSVGKRDLILVGLAGHGLQPDKEAFFCPMDANPSRLKTLIGLGELLQVLDDSGVGEKLVLVDACRNDPKIRGRRGIERVDVAALPPQTGVLLSCAPGEFAFEHKDLGRGHGIFFYHVIEGLKGDPSARDADGEVTWDSLRAYVKKRVPQTVVKLYGKDGGEQRPNDIGNLIGESPQLVKARIEIKPDPKPKYTKPISRPEEPPVVASQSPESTSNESTYVPSEPSVSDPPANSEEMPKSRNASSRNSKRKKRAHKTDGSAFERAVVGQFRLEIVESRTGRREESVLEIHGDKTITMNDGTSGTWSTRGNLLIVSIGGIATGAAEPLEDGSFEGTFTNRANGLSFVYRLTRLP